MIYRQTTALTKTTSNASSHGSTRGNVSRMSTSQATVAKGSTRSSRVGAKRLSDKDIDMALVQRVQRGDKSAFDVLVLKYQHKIGHLISRYVHDSHEAQDVAQEAFIKAYRGLAKEPLGHDGAKNYRHRYRRRGCRAV